MIVGGRWFHPTIGTLRVNTSHNVSKDSDTIDYIKRMEHGIIAMVGSGKQGKSCSLHSLIDICFPDRRKVILDDSGADVSIFPGYTGASKVSDIPLDSVVVIEDVNRVFHSRGSSKDPTLQKWLGVISHKGNVVCFTTQSLAGTDLEFLRSQDSVIVHKRMHHEDLNFERPEFREEQVFANDWIDSSSNGNPKRDQRSWCFFPRFNECVSIPKVEWWDDRHSHMFRTVRIS